MSRWIPFSTNRWQMTINYVPVTIGVDDGTPYEEIYPTVADFVTAWTGDMVNNVVLYFSDSDDFVRADDPSLNPINQDATYYVETTGMAINEVVISSEDDFALDKRDDCIDVDTSNGRMDISDIKSMGSTTEKKVVSYGFRIPVSYGTASSSSMGARYRRTALVDMSGVLTVVLPTFTMTYPNSIVTETPFTNTYRVQIGIEPLFKDSDNVGDSLRVVSEVVELPINDSIGFSECTVDLGDTIIPKDQEYGIWVAIDNMSGNYEFPYSRNLGSTQSQIYESYNASNTSLIDSNYIEDATSIPTIPLGTTYRRCYSPVAILMRTNDTTNSYGLYGSSIIEGAYDDNGIGGDQYGENGAIAIYDKLFTSNWKQPTVNVSKGSERLNTAIGNFSRRSNILGVCNITHAISGLGSNDIESTDLPTMKANTAIFHSMLRSVVGDDLVCVVSTILPRTTSTDGFASTTNQTPRSNTSGDTSYRGSWNVYVRSLHNTINPNSEGINNVIDVCASVEMDYLDNSGIWNVGDNSEPPSTYVVDGIHPTGVGSSKIGANTEYDEHFYPTAGSTLKITADINTIQQLYLMDCYPNTHPDRGFVFLNPSGNWLTSGCSISPSAGTVGRTEYTITFDGTKKFTKFFNGWNNLQSLGGVCDKISGDEMSVEFSFGEDTAVDTISGYTFDIVNCSSWKSGVDQHFTTAQLFKSQLPVVPVEFQNVTDINVGIPPTGDSYWEAYDNNWLMVNKWSSGSLNLTGGMATYPSIGLCFKIRQGA